MTFAEKLSFLMKLTNTSNKQLADALNVDPSLISRLRSSRRSAPKNLSYIKGMAELFAKKCSSNYQRVALCEALGRKLLQIQAETPQLASVLFDWLTDSRDQVGEFFGKLDSFNIDSGEAPDGSYVPNSSAVSFAYYGNEGKRTAFSVFVEHALSLDKPGVICLSEDENQEWMIEDQAYLSYLHVQLKKLTERGFRIRRIAPPFYCVDQAFDSLESWLPLYMTGQVDAFYYPRLRDDMFRRSTIVIKNEIAMVSTSVVGQTFSGATVLTREARLVNAFADEYDLILKKCKPMTTMYSMDDSADQVLRCISQFDSDKGDSIHQSTTLSTLTAPNEVVKYAVSLSGEPEAETIVDALTKSRDMLIQSLADYTTTDIHSIATAEEVAAGKVPIGVGYLCRSAPVCYTPKTYALHLRSILSLMEKYDNYKAVLLPRSAENQAMLIKEGRHALLLRTNKPFKILEISQPNIAMACREYLLRRIEGPLSDEISRQETISTLRSLIAELRSL